MTKQPKAHRGCSSVDMAGTFLLALLFLPVSASARESGATVSSWTTSVEPRKDRSQQPSARRRGVKSWRKADSKRPPSIPVAPQTMYYEQGQSIGEAGGGEIVGPAPVQSIAENYVANGDAVAATTFAERYRGAAAEYCRTLSQTADEARAAFLQREIALLEKQLVLKTEALEGRIAEHKRWLSLRSQEMDQVSISLVQTFMRMRPEAAAQQISVMDDRLAAVLLLKLGPKASSALLNEMAPPRAARLVAAIASSAGVGVDTKEKAADQSR